MEEKRFNQEGALTTDGPDSYKIPSAKDIPKEFNVTLLRNMRTPEDHLYSSKVINKKLSSRTQNQFWGQILKLFSFDSWNNNITVKEMHTDSFCVDVFNELIKKCRMCLFLNAHPLTYIHVLYSAGHVMIY